MIKVDGSVATINIKYFAIGLHVIYLYFPDALLIYCLSTATVVTRTLLSVAM
jgi:hypothetical protein